MVNKQYPEVKPKFQTEAWLERITEFMKQESQAARYILSVDLLRLLYKNDKEFIVKVIEYNEGKIIRKLIKDKKECPDSLTFYSIVRAIRDILFIKD